MQSVSIIVPMRNEAENIGPLVDGIAAACASLDAFEIIIVDDGSTDATGTRAIELQTKIPTLRLIQHPNSAGQSAAVHSGVLAARHPVICTLDGDGQNPPDQLPKLWGPLLADASGTLGLVAGQRVNRQDTAAKRIGSKFANALRGWLLNDGTRDTGCGLKGFRKDGFLRLPYFDHMHRYLPALFKRDGWAITHVDVTHKERVAGTSNYSNFGRAMVGIYDLFGVAWLIRRKKKATPSEAGAE